MKRGRRVWLLLPEAVRRTPADLAAVIGLTLLTILVVVMPGVRETPVRVVFGLPFVLFLPGYAFIAALFPEAGEPPTANGEESAERSRLRDRGIDGIERVALSFGLSIAIVPLIGLVLNFTPWGITLFPILMAVGGFTIACGIVATARRRELPADERFSVPYRTWVASARAEVFEPDDRMDAALNVLLALSILLAVGSVGYAVAVPPDGERFTEFYVLTEDDDGELVAANYPTEFEAGDEADLVLGIGNNEHEEVSYTVVIQLERVEHANNETTVLERSELDRFPVELAHNDTWLGNLTVAPNMVGEELRLTFLLYQGDAPASAARETAYRDLHLWIDVEPAE